MNLKILVKDDYYKGVFIDGEPIPEVYLVEIKIATPSDDSNTIKVYRYKKENDKIVIVDDEAVTIIDEYLVKGEIVFDTEVIPVEKQRGQT